MPPSPPRLELRFIAEKCHKIRCKYRHDNTKCEKWEINAKIESAILIMETLKIICYNTNVYVVTGVVIVRIGIVKMLDEDLRKQFDETYRLLNHDINRYILLLEKGVYPYNCMIGKKFRKHHYLKKKIFTIA